MIDSNVTGIANAARKIPITTSLHSQERSDGRNTRVRYSFGRDRITPPCLAWSPELLDLPPEDTGDDHDQKTAPTAIMVEKTGYSERLPRFRSNEPGTERKRYRYTKVPATVKKIFCTR